MDNNSQSYEANLKKIQATAEELVGYLVKHPKVERVLYPKLAGKEHYDLVKRNDGCYGGLFSMELKDASRVTSKFYDSLNFCKGPSLGTVFTIICPYTLLAHYYELEWAESCGVSRNLLRVSVGLEPYEVLKDRFDKALSLVN